MAVELPVRCRRQNVAVCMSLCLWLCLALSGCAGSAAATPATEASTRAGACGGEGVWVQVLGSGGPELTDQRASSGYLVWVDGRSRVWIDIGAGTVHNFERAGGDMRELDMLLLSHLHVDHSADLPALVKGSYFIKRDRELPVVGPAGNQWMPATDVWVERLFASNEGAFQYLGDFLDPAADAGGYQITPQVYREVLRTTRDMPIEADAVSVVHGPIPALAWRIKVAGVAIVFSGDMASAKENFLAMLEYADLFVAHNAIPEQATGVAARLHMPPSLIGKYAERGKVRNLLLSHRMSRTLGDEANTMALIRRHYQGRLAFADDMDCIPVG